MSHNLTPVARAFHDVPDACRLPCGITAHLVDPSHIGSAGASRHGRHDRVSQARHTGWYADRGQFEILTGFVYAFADDPGDADGDAPQSYYALVESDDTDCHYLDPDVYGDPIEAAHAADRMAELIAELERECDAIREQAMRAHGELAEANRTRREALASCAICATARPTAPRSVPRSRGSGGWPTPAAAARSSSSPSTGLRRAGARSTRTASRRPTNAGPTPGATVGTARHRRAAPMRQFSRSRSALPALNAATRDAAISIASPVCGLRPVRAPRSRTSNVPNPGTATGSPAARPAATASSTASTASPAAERLNPVLSATAATSSLLFIFRTPIQRCALGANRPI